MYHVLEIMFLVSSLGASSMSEETGCFIAALKLKHIVLTSAAFL
jgi:hypothetical protein